MRKANSQSSNKNKINSTIVECAFLFSSCLVCSPRSVNPMEPTHSSIAALYSGELTLNSIPRYRVMTLPGGKAPYDVLLFFRQLCCELSLHSRHPAKEQKPSKSKFHETKAVSVRFIRHITNYVALRGRVISLPFRLQWKFILCKRSFLANDEVEDEKLLGDSWPQKFNL